MIAVDNASADDTVDRLREWPEITVVRLPRNIGAAARNDGARRATTPYVAFCDDDGWYEADGLRVAVALLDRHPALALVNARILVGEEGRLDPISAEMADSPLPEEAGIPGSVLLSFMAGAVVVRRSAFLGVGGYHPRFFLGGEEETVSIRSPTPAGRCGTSPRWSCTTIRASPTPRTCGLSGCATRCGTPGCTAAGARRCAGRCSPWPTPRRTATGSAVSEWRWPACRGR